MSEIKLYDIIIIGGGIAGLTAAIYARRAGKDVALFENNSFGGQISLSPSVENYPAFSAISGAELSDKLLNQAMSLGAEMIFSSVYEITDSNSVIADSGEYKAAAIIIANGMKHRKTGLANEERLTGKGVSYCAVCDGGFYKNKNVAVYGGGNTAIGDAIFLSDICNSVTVIHRRDEFRADESLVKTLKAKKNVKFLLDSVVTDIVGTDRVEGLKIRNKKTKNETEITVSGVFIAIGQIPQNEAFKNIVELDDYGFIKAGENCKTSKEGIFAAGDCRTKELRQLVTAAADGAVAATEACKYIDKLSL